MKRSGRKTSKKKMPKDLIRVTNASGKRVWRTGGKEYESLKDVADALKIGD